MGKGLKVKVNPDPVNRFLASYGRRTTKGVEGVIAETALLVETKAKMKVPKDKGILASSIRALRQSKLTWKVLSNLPYARYIEFAKPEGTGPHGGPRPYLIPAFKEETKKITRKLKRVFR